MPNDPRSREEPPASAAEVVVSVIEESRTRISEVAVALQGLGLRDAEALPTVGIITGWLSEVDSLRALRECEGVESLELPRGVQLPPPDEPIQ